MLIKTKKDWNEVLTILIAGRPAHFNIDGYNVHIFLRHKDFRPVYIPCVNEGLAESWVEKPDADFVMRFYPIEQKNIYTKKSIKAVERQQGKRKARQMGAYDTVLVVHLWWSDFKKLMKHYSMVNKKILLFESSVLDNAITLVPIDGGYLVKNLV